MIKTIKNFLNNDKIQDAFELVAKLLFLVYAMFGFNSYFYGQKIVSCFMWPAMLFCVIAICWRAIRIKRYFYMTGFVLSVLFIGSHCLSSVLNISYAFKDNVVLAIYFAIYFLLFYVFPLKKEPVKVKKEFNIVSFFYVFYATIGSLISIVMFVKGYSTVEYFGLGGYEVVTGFRWGRLWGIFLDPNRGALIMLLAILLVVYLIFTLKNKVFKSMLVVSILPMFLYIVFSDSRTSLVSIFFAVITGLVVWFLGQPLPKVKLLFRNIVLCLLIPTILAISPLATKKAYNTYVTSLNQATEENLMETPIDDTNEEPIETPTEAPIEAPTETPTEAPTETPTEPFTDSSAEPSTEVGTENTVDFQTIDRDYDLSQDVSNRRFDIWKSGIEMFVVNPVFGYSYNGIRLYALEHMPETYIVNNEVNLFSNFHNEVLNVLASQGLVGFLIFAAFVVLVIVLLFKKLKFVTKENKKSVAVMMAIVVGLASGAMFVSLMVYTFCALSPIFWMCLGYLVYLLKNTTDSKVDAE